MSTNRQDERIALRIRRLMEMDRLDQKLTDDLNELRDFVVANRPPITLSRKSTVDRYYRMLNTIDRLRAIQTNKALRAAK